MNNKDVSANFFMSKYFFSESDFCMNTSHFFNTISKMFNNISLSSKKDETTAESGSPDVKNKRITTVTTF